MKYPSEIVDIGTLYRLFCKEVMRHFRLGVCYDLGKMLGDTTKRWKALSDRYAGRATRASDVDDGPIFKVSYG
ncbi:hypothetical protein MMC22_010947 [Lobaria immixta]|nr:hypothetical protein [Lobaria immixta]